MSCGSRLGDQKQRSWLITGNAHKLAERGKLTQRRIFVRTQSLETGFQWKLHHIAKSSGNFYASRNPSLLVFLALVWKQAIQWMCRLFVFLGHHTDNLFWSLDTSVWTSEHEGRFRRKHGHIIVAVFPSRPSFVRILFYTLLCVLTFTVKFAVVMNQLAQSQAILTYSVFQPPLC